jgi:hypothetical protein
MTRFGSDWEADTTLPMERRRAGSQAKGAFKKPSLQLGL